MHRAVRIVTKEIEEALQLSVELLKCAPPRKLEACCQESPCLVFTDGAYEAGIATCGAVIFSPRLDEPVAFGFEVPADVLAEWHSFGNEQVIAQAEMLPVVLVKKCFDRLVRGARVLFFIDNDGVKEAFVSGRTKSVASRRMLVEAMVQDSQNNSLNWYTRIPSPSNISDPASRLKWDELKGMINYKFVNVEWDYWTWGKVRVVPCK